MRGLGLRFQRQQCKISLVLLRDVVAEISLSQWAPDIAEYPELSARAHFFKYGIAGTDSAAGEVPAMYTLQSLMTQNGRSATLRRP